MVCRFKTNDLKNTWKEMSKFAHNGSFLWINDLEFSEQAIKVIGCLSPCCEEKHEDCQLGEETVIFVGHSRRRRASTVAIEVELNSSKLKIYGSGKQFIWIKPSSGKFFNGDAFGLCQCEIKRPTGFVGALISLKCSLVSDISVEQSTYKDLILKKKARKAWGLDGESDSKRMDLSGNMEN